MHGLSLVVISNFFNVGIVRVGIIAVGIVRVGGVVQVGFDCPWFKLFRVGIARVGDVRVGCCPGVHNVYIISTRKSRFYVGSILRSKMQSNIFLEV